MKKMFKQYNYFYTEEEYKDIWENGLFVFDTNTLLNLYRYQDETRNKFFQILNKISDRIWIPHHVALEFYRNRLKVICDQKVLFSETTNAINKAKSTLSSELEKLQLNKRHSSINVSDFVSKFDELIKDFNENLNELRLSQNHVSHPEIVKNQLENIFDNKVGNPPKCQEEIDEFYKEAENRYKLNIPPGYLDNAKEEVCIDSNLRYRKKFGDFLVWKQILEHCKEKKISKLVFITNDLKDDWWSKYNASGERFNQPRPELIDEALRVGGVSHFIMYDSEKFLSSSSIYLDIEVSDNALKEVKDTIEIYNQDITRSNFQRLKENRIASFEILKKATAIEKVKKFENKINYELYRNGGIAEFHTEVLTCPECGLETMIPHESSLTGYKCTYCENEESDEIEVECTICGVMWPNSEIEPIEWTDEGHIERVCPYCRRDPDYVKDD